MPHKRKRTAPRKPGAGGQPQQQPEENPFASAVDVLRGLARLATEHPLGTFAVGMVFGAATFGKPGDTQRALDVVSDAVKIRKRFLDALKGEGLPARNLDDLKPAFDAEETPDEKGTKHHRGLHSTKT